MVQYILNQHNKIQIGDFFLVFLLFFPFRFSLFSFYAAWALECCLFKIIKQTFLKDRLIRQYLAKFKIMSFDPTFLLLDNYCAVYLSKIAKICSIVFFTTLFVIGPNWKQCTIQSMRGLVRKIGCRFSGIAYSCLKNVLVMRRCPGISLK